MPIGRFCRTRVPHIDIALASIIASRRNLMSKNDNVQNSDGATVPNSDANNNVQYDYNGPPPYDPYWPPPPSYYPPPHKPMYERVCARLHEKWHDRPRIEKAKIAGAFLIVAGVLCVMLSSIMLAAELFAWDANDDVSTFQGISTVHGLISFPNGTGVEGAKVSVSNSGLEGVTNETGAYIIRGVPNGACDIKVEKAGYKTIIYHTTLADNAWTSNSYDFTIVPGEGTMKYGYNENNALELRGWSFASSCTALTMVGGILALVGGVEARKGKRYELTIVGAIGGIVGIGFGLGALLSLIALFMLLMSADEFKKEM